VSIEVCIIWYQSIGSKISFTIFIFCFLLSSYLVPFVFFIVCSYFVTCTKSKLCSKFPKKNWKKRRDVRKEKKRRKKIVCSFNSLKPKYFFSLSSSFDSLFL